MSQGFHGLGRAFEAICSFPHSYSRAKMCSWIGTYIKGFILVTAVLAELGCIAVWSCPEDLHYRLQSAQLQQTVSSIATNSQLSCNKQSAQLQQTVSSVEKCQLGGWLDCYLPHLNWQSARITQCARGAEPIISWPSSNCQLSCG